MAGRRECVPGLLHEDECRREIDAERLVPRFDRLLAERNCPSRQRRASHERSRVHDHVEPAELGGHLAHRGARSVLAAQVGGDGDAADPTRDCLRSLAVGVAHGDRGAELGERLRGGGADVPGASRHERAPAVEAHQFRDGAHCRSSGASNVKRGTARASVRPTSDSRLAAGIPVPGRSATSDERVSTEPAGRSSAAATLRLVTEMFSSSAATGCFTPSPIAADAVRQARTMSASSCGSSDAA